MANAIVSINYKVILVNPILTFQFPRRCILFHFQILLVQRAQIHEKKILTNKFWLEKIGY